MNVRRLRKGDLVRWYFNPTDYIICVVDEVCEDGTCWAIEFGTRLRKKYKESELYPHTEDEVQADMRKDQKNEL